MTPVSSDVGVASHPNPAGMASTSIDPTGTANGTVACAYASPVSHAGEPPESTGVPQSLLSLARMQKSTFPPWVPPFTRRTRPFPDVGSEGAGQAPSLARYVTS